MGGESQSDSENSEKSNSNDEENAFNHGDGEEEVISEYEKQRLERIKENKARLESLRLPSLASSLLGSVKNKDKRKEKNKRGKEEDEEYKPSDGEERASSSSNEEGDEEEEDEEEEENKSPEASNSKGKNRQSSHKSKRKTKRFVQKRRRRLDYVDDDEALKQAIALSLEDSSEVSGAVLLESLHNSRTGVTDVQEIDKRKKKRQSNTSRVQMTEDQAIIHFFQFDARDACGQWETKFKCKYCGKTMKDGCLTGLMKHLAGCFSKVAASEHVPPQVKEEMRNHLSERASSISPKRVRKRHPRVVWPQEEEVEDPELRLQQDIEEAMRRSMKDPEYKEMEEIKLAMLESQRPNSQYLKGTSSSRTLQSKMIVENSDDELDQIFGFDNEDDDDDAN